MGFTARAPKNESAIYVTFGTPSLGIPSALARVFDRVCHHSLQQYLVVVLTNTFENGYKACNACTHSLYFS